MRTIEQKCAFEVTAIRSTAHNEQTELFKRIGDVSLAEQALKNRYAHAERCERDAMKNNDNQRIKIYQLEGEVAKMTRYDETVSYTHLTLPTIYSV